jgi:hypothetical protein
MSSGTKPLEKAMNQQSLSHRCFVASFAFIVGVAVGAASLAFYNQIEGRRNVVLRNPSDDVLAAKLQGNWVLKDLRVADPKGTPVTFTPTGVSKNDPVFSERWFCSDGLLFISYARIDGVQQDGKDHLFCVIPTFDDSSDSMTIAFPGKEPHAILTRDRS